jgi:hypothetical protein
VKAKPLTDAGLRRIEAVLGPSVNPERLRAELERRSAPSAQELEQISKLEGARRKHAEACRQLLTMEQQLDEPHRQLCQLLLAREQWAAGEANRLAEAGKEPEIRAHYLGLIHAYAIAGGHVGVTTPYKPKDDASYPEPESEFVAYFIAVVREVLDRDVSAYAAKHWASVYRHIKFAAATFSGAGDFHPDQAEDGIA